MMNLYTKWLTELESNNKQSEAFHKAGNTVVIAGPGSGKTRVLALKVAQLLRDDIQQPQGIACLTYTRMMAMELYRRIYALGISERPNIFVGTVHAFSLGQVVLPYQKVFDLGLPKTIRISPNSIQEKCFHDAMAKVFEADYDPDNNKKIKETFYKLRRQRADVPFDQWKDNQNIGEAIALYEKNLFTLGFIDFDIIVRSALKLIVSQELVRKSLCAKFPWFAIDEYQDLGYPLYRIVTEMLTRTSIGLFAIGDPHQAIFDFAGTDPKYLIQLSKRTDMIPEINLEVNYRSRQEIIDVAGAILNKQRKSFSQFTGGHCILVECQWGQDEQNQLVLSLIKKYQAAGVPNDEIAILYRWRKNLKGMAQFLNGIGVDYVIDKHPLYDRTMGTIKWLEDLAYWCLGGWKKQDSDRHSFSDLLSIWKQYGKIPGLENDDTNHAQIYLADVLWKLRDQDIKLHDWLLSVSEALHLEVLFEQYQDFYPDEVEEFHNLFRLTMPGKALCTLSLSKFANMIPGIQLTTLHSSKGTEYEVVIIAGVESVENNINGRRLLYVGATRAKRELCMLYTKTKPFWSKYPILPEPIKQLKATARRYKWKFVENIKL